MQSHLRCLYLLTALITLSLNSSAQLKLPALVSDNMILQQSTPVRIWGWSTPGEQITISFQKKQYQTVTGANKKWELMLPAMKAGGPYDMTIKGPDEITIHNILIGEVWVCSGQSNMEFPMSRIKHLHQADIIKASNSPIREFSVKQQYSYVPVSDVQGSWQQAGPQTIDGFSAVGFFLAFHLYEKYKVPVGIIHSSWPGTPAESWISEEGLKDFPHYIEQARPYHNTAYVDSLLKRDKDVSNAWYANVNKHNRGGHEEQGWQPVNFPGYWEDQGQAGLDGLVWLKKQIDIPVNIAKKDAVLELGLIDDIDSTFVNGKFVGYSNNKYLPRRYRIPAGLLTLGLNTITIRVIDNEGKGGFAPGKHYGLIAGTDTLSLSGQWQYKIDYASNPLPVATFTRVFYKPECLYYGMIEPITPYTIKGVAWYQSEANSGGYKAFEYRHLLPAMIREWRTKWAQGNFPFLIVQLANYMDPKPQPSASGWAMLRESQSVVASTEPNCGLAVAIDIGEQYDVHPFNKKTVGKRLALQAQKIAYGDQKTVVSGPIYKSMQVKGEKIVLTFTNIGSGLMAKNGHLKQFAIAGEDKKFIWGNAVIKGNQVIVYAPELKQPVAVRYAWADNPEGCNLYNKEGLPASPFRTDNWEK